jgi:hypothetical protein
MKKKLSFTNIKNTLSRGEMKMIMAGSGNYTCNATATQGYHVESPGSCSGTLSGCQSACDSWCTGANHCASCTCS